MYIIYNNSNYKKYLQVMHHFNLNKYLGIQANIDELDNNIDEPLHVPEDDLVPEVTDNLNTKNAGLCSKLLLSFKLKVLLSSYGALYRKFAIHCSVWSKITFSTIM